jgi:hypothetical protein
MTVDHWKNSLPGLDFCIACLEKKCRECCIVEAVATIADEYCCLVIYSLTGNIAQLDF